MPSAGHGHEYGAVATDIVLNIVEISNLKTFAEEHDGCSTGYPARFNIESTPGSLCSTIRVTCVECNTVKNISDYDSI